MITLARFHTILVCTLGMACLSGCGQADYEKGMENTANKLKQAGKFSSLSLFPIAISDTPCQVRLPETFVNRSGIRFFAAAADGESGPKLAELQPPFLKLPDLKLAFQTMGSDDKGAQYPYFCYLAALPPGATFTVPTDKPPATEPKTDVPAEPQPDAATENKPDAPAESKPETPAENKPEGSTEQPAAEKPEEKPTEDKPAGEAAPANKPLELSVWIEAELAKAFPDQKEKPKWEPVEAPTPVLGQAPIPWKRIIVEGIQPFQFIGGSSSDFLEHVEGKFILYMCERDGTTVLVGWRIPKALEGKAPMEQWALLSAGTLRP